MYIQGKYASEVTSQDILDLIKNKVRESKSLDYKRELNLGTDKDDKKGKFLHDVLAMYNTEGGCIIYGIEEEKVKGKNTSYPKEVYGLKIENFDKLSQQINSLIRDYTDPVLSVIEFINLKVEDKDVIILGIPKTQSIPSMNTYGGVNNFPRRNSSGNHVSTTFELTQMFQQSLLFKEKSEQFRQQRIKDIRDTKIIPHVLVNGSTFLHLIPYNFQNELLLNLKSLQALELEKIKFPFLSADYYEKRGLSYNLEGLLAYKSHSKQGYTNYHQYFRNGAIEIYTSNCLSTNEHPDTKNFHSATLIRFVVISIYRCQAIFKHFKIEPPYIAYLSLCDLNGLTLIGPNSTCPGKFSRNEINLPNIVFNSLDLEVKDIFEILHPYFEIIWQAADGEEFPSFEECKNHFKIIN
ncbi:helix-turn-helix domain-containing protein [Paraflavitalea pollutisoli]|uniref:AlbA family DNA-binding domain-containing protein n=1 Tax=Paraflavitalea pollutisoli TaxID=3034143 RepID=UPI0023EDFFE0|nr:ATP-binding protein [Paraflavitalea sp. H1-2-19X]